jgi:hypothetical protein
MIPYECFSSFVNLSTGNAWLKNGGNMRQCFAVQNTRQTYQLNFFSRLVNYVTTLTLREHPHDCLLPYYCG